MCLTDAHGARPQCIQAHWAGFPACPRAGRAFACLPQTLQHCYQRNIPSALFLCLTMCEHALKAARTGCCCRWRFPPCSAAAHSHCTPKKFRRGTLTSKSRQHSAACHHTQYLHTNLEWSIIEQEWSIILSKSEDELKYILRVTDKTAM